MDAVMPPVPAGSGEGAGPEGEKRPPIDRTALGLKLSAELKEAVNARSLYELRWIEDLRQYKGFYPPAVFESLRKSGKSRVFYRLTTHKTDTMVARLMDLLFPQRTKNWAITATPDPELPPETLAADMADELAAIMRQMQANAMQNLAAQNIVPDELAQQKLMQGFYENAVARLNTPENRQRIGAARAKRMETLIDDELKECNANGQRRPSWSQSCRAVVHDACLYGMGVLKGPLVERVASTRFVSGRDEFGQDFWREEVVAERLRPYHEAVSIWEIFPDPDARAPGELRHVWQAHLMSDKDLKDLKTFPGFDAAAIEAYMREHEEGDAIMQSWESQLRELDRERTGGEALKRRFRVWERWGFLTGAELADAGADIPEANRTAVYSSNVWMIGDNVIIKAMVNPLEGVDIPFFWYPFERDDSCFWPEGIASRLRFPQAGINAAVRAMQDNMAFSAGPFVALNMQLLSAEDAADVQGALNRRMLCFDRGGVTLGNAFQAVNIPSCVQENLTAIQFWMNAADEITTPRFNAGDGNVKGAGETASGLSMLMGASNILLKDHVKDFDDQIVTPFIRAMYRWNMQWSDREDCKGDFEVVASGSQSLIAKEVRAQQMPIVLNYLALPQFADSINARALLEVALEQTDLPVERILYTEEEAKRNAMERERQAAAANVEALTQKLQEQGLTPEQISQQLLLLTAQMGAGQTAQPASGAGGQP